jgi:hypothetical protein
MIIQYIKLAVRNLLRKKLYTVINLTGLAIAGAFAILMHTEYSIAGGNSGYRRSLTTHYSPLTTHKKV